MSTIQEKEKGIRKFISSNSRNEWLYWDDAELYLCKKIFAVGETTVPCLTISNISVSSPRQGTFKQILAIVEACGYPVVVENVLNKVLLPFLERKGYRKIKDYNGVCPSYYKENGGRLLMVAVPGITFLAGTNTVIGRAQYKSLSGK